MAILAAVTSSGAAASAAPGDAPAASATAAAPSAGAPTVAECTAWHATGQKLRYGSKLLESREPLRGCSHEACPELVRTDCTAWLLEVQQSLPSATFTASSS